MKNAFVVGWRNIADGRRRSILTGLSTALGVALLTTAVLGGLTSRQTVVGGIESLVSLGDVGVVPGPGRELLQQDAVPDLAALPGVDSVLPTLSRETVLTGGGLSDEPALLTGVPVGPDSLAALVVTEGRLPSADATEMLVPSRLTTDADVSVGTPVSVATPNGPVRFTVVGVVDQQSLGVFADGHVFTSLGNAQTTYGLDGALTRIDLTLDAADADGWTTLHQRDLPEGAAFQDTAAIARGIEPVATAVSVVTGLLGVLALSLSTMLVASASLGAVRSRRTTYAALRAIGADRRWIGASVLAETAIVCGAGTVVGAVVGVLTGIVPGQDIPGPVSIALAIGIGVTGGIVAGGAGALRAVREVMGISPALQLRGLADRDVRAAGRARPVTLIIGSAAVTGVCIAAASGGTNLAMLGVVGCALLSMIAARALVRPASVITARCLRSGELASRDERTVRRQVAAPVAMVVFGGVLLSSTVGAVSDATVTQIERQFGADVQVTSMVPLREVPDFGSVDGVGLIASASTGTASLSSGTSVIDVPVQAVDSDAWFDVAQLPWLDVGDTEGAASVRAASGIAVPRGVAEMLGVEAGDDVVLTRGGVDREVTIAGTFTSLATGQQIVVDRSLGRALGFVDVSRWDISAAPGVEPEMLAERVDDLVGQQPGVQVITGHETRTRATTEIVGLTAGLFAVVALTIGLGALGASSALNSNVERRRGDLAILRAIGADRRFVARVIATDVTVVAVVGILGGVAGGLVGGFLGTGLVSGLLGVALPQPIPWSLAGGVVGVTVVALTLAAVAPLRSALTTDPLIVMRAEAT